VRKGSFAGKKYIMPIPGRLAARQTPCLGDSRPFGRAHSRLLRSKRDRRGNPNEYVDCTTRRWTNVRDADVEFLPGFGGFGGGGLRKIADLAHKTGLSGGIDGRERRRSACNLDHRIGGPLEQRAFGTGVQARGALGARVVSARISSPTRTRSSTG
jgi:hypothetical protein